MTTPPSATIEFKTDTHIKNPTLARLGRWTFYLLFGIACVSMVTQAVLLWQYAFSEQLLFHAVFAEWNFSPAIFASSLVFSRCMRFAIFAIVAWLIFSRQPDDRMNLVAAIWLVTMGTSITSNTLSSLIFYETDLGRFPLFVSGLGWTLLYLVISIFPDGRWHHRLLIPCFGLWLIFSFFWTIPPIDSAWNMYNWNPVFALLFNTALTLALLFAFLRRYRQQMSPLQQQQSKWFIFATVWIFFTFVIISAIDASITPRRFGAIPAFIMEYVGMGADISYILVPIGLAIAILRYRLWEADMMINRSLVYFIITLLALFIFFFDSTMVQILFGNQQPLVALGISVLIIVLAFNPVRNKVQNLVDRKIFGLRFDLNELKEAHEGNVKKRGALTGTVLGGYQLLDILGKGGMGAVYKAQGHGRIVAIKTLQVGLSDSVENLQRFQREADAGMSLNHPNIAHVYEISVQDNTPYMVMEYLEGQDLSALLKEQGKFDLEATRSILRDLAAALDEAHRKGFVHRDIKPSNVMLVPNPDGETQRAVLTDFGITKMKDANTLTGTGAIGTIDYMAPEQIVNAKSVDHRADIYALGILTYEMLLGERPFTGNAAQVLFAHIQQPPPDVRDKDEDLPRHLAKAILQALAKKPEERFESAGVFVGQL